MSDQPRGIRNNNPGNIEYRPSADPWLGLADPPSDGRFCRFTEPVYGLRAIAKILLTYQSRYGLTTVRQLIGRWAPPGENDTDGYVQDVADRLGVSPDSPVDVSAELVAALVRHENGVMPYATDLLDRAVLLART